MLVGTGEPAPEEARVSLSDTMAQAFWAFARTAVAAHAAGYPFLRFLASERLMGSQDVVLGF
jgi:hypothetical protein